MILITTMLAATHPIVHVNASLNLVATILLVIGLWLIKRGRVEAHKRTMLAAFAVSAAFLVGYVWYHVVMKVGSVRFTHPGAVRYVYFSILISHVILGNYRAAASDPTNVSRLPRSGCCPPPGHQAEQLTVAAAFREKHIRLARWTFPIWLYVSITGVIVYVMLYHLWPPAAE